MCKQTVCCQSNVVAHNVPHIDNGAAAFVRGSPPCIISRRCSQGRDLLFFCSLGFNVRGVHNVRNVDGYHLAACLKPSDVKGENC